MISQGFETPPRPVKRKRPFSELELNTPLKLRPSAPPKGLYAPKQLSMVDAYRLERLPDHPNPAIIKEAMHSPSGRLRKLREASEWIANQGVPPWQAVEYLSADGLAQLKVNFSSKGVALWKGAALGSRKDDDLVGQKLVVIGLDQQFYCHGDRYPQTNTSGPHFHHSSFWASNRVYFAGTVETKQQGVITKLTNDSGHYKTPKANLIYACQFLSLKMSAKDFDQLVVVYHSGEKTQTLLASTFLANEFKSGASPKALPLRLKLPQPPRSRTSREQAISHRSYHSNTEVSKLIVAKSAELKRLTP